MSTENTIKDLRKMKEILQDAFNKIESEFLSGDLVGVSMETCYHLHIMISKIDNTVKGLKEK